MLFFRRERRLGVIRDRPHPFRRGASYVDRMLRGTPAADLPVELPTKFKLGVNLKTAKDLDLEVLPSLLARGQGDRRSDWR